MGYEDAIEILMKNAKTSGLSQTEIARKSHLSDSQISRIFRFESKASDDALVALAKAFNYPSETILKIAHNLTELKTDPITEEALHILNKLEGEDKEEALRYLRMRREIAEERDERNAKKRKARPATSG